MPASLTPQEALIYAMITVSAVDRSMSDAELARIGSIVQQLPAFQGRDRDWLVEKAEACGAVLAGPDGLDRVLDMIHEALPQRLRETAYVLAAEVAATDLRVKVEEVRLLELLAEKLGLDNLTCAALERGAKARHQKA
ncbi:MAG: tellurite resistance TerB family protein [Hyphomicrobiaceae bacterium]|nr:tellurite resistance TerB family protein [Hyphomicrobiaceae bacterium]